MFIHIQLGNIACYETILIYFSPFIRKLINKYDYEALNVKMDRCKVGAELPYYSSKIYSNSTMLMKIKFVYT